MSLRIELQTTPVVNLALQQMDVPVVSQLVLTNASDEHVGPVRIRITLDPPVAPAWEHIVAWLRPSEQVVFDSAQVRLLLSHEALARQQRAVVGALTLTVSCGATNEVVSRALTVQPFDHWAGFAHHPESLASFVSPNHPVLGSLLAQVVEATGDRTQAAWSALQGLGMVMLASPTASATQGHALRSLETLLAEQHASPLELATLFAAVMERLGARPVIVLGRDHVLVGVIEGALSAAAIDDVEEVITRVKAGHLRLVAPSTLTTRMSFEAACQLADKLLIPAALIGAIDIAQCRVGHLAVRPLPVTTAPTLEVEAVARVTFEARPQALSSASPVVSASAGEQRIERWKSRLLDLSLRNPLLNFKPDGTNSLPLVASDVADLENHLSTREPFALGRRYDPNSRSESLFEQRTGRSMRDAQAKDLWKQHVLLPDLSAQEAERRIVAIYRRARTLAEETGSNGAWLVVGFFEWSDPSQPNEVLRAPIILLPVAITRGPPKEPFLLRLTDDEPRINATLLKKLELDFQVDVTGLDALPDDEQGLDVAAILRRFHQVALNLKPQVARASVRETAAIGLLSFAKHMMWLDLEARTADLLKNPIVKHLLDPLQPIRQGSFLQAHELDTKRAPAVDHTVVDADSSQLVAVQAAIDGNTFVLEGPPGTGKSQTITNLIAELMAEGQSVLFVAEKRAAIEVVKARLDKAGLGAFCLDLHAHDASKLDIITALAAPLELERHIETNAWDRVTAELAVERAALAETWNALHLPGAADVSVWQAVARLEVLGREPLVRHDFEAGVALVSARWRELVHATHAYAVAATVVGRPALHAFSTSRMSDWNPRREAASERALEGAANAVPPLASALRSLTKQGLTLRAATRERLARLSDFIATERPVPDGAAALLVAAVDPAARRRIADAAELARRRSLARETLSQRYRVDALLDLDTTTLEAKFTRWSTAFVLIAFVALFFARRRVKQTATGALPTNVDLARDLGIANALRSDERSLAGRDADVRLALGDATTSAAIALRIANLPERLAWCERRRTSALALLSHVVDPTALERAPGTIDSDATSALVEARATYERTLTTLAQELELERGPLDGEATLEAIGEQIQRWWSELRELRDWATYVRTRAAMEVTGLHAFVGAFELGRVPAEELDAALQRSAMTWRIDDALAHVPTLSRFQGHAHEARAAAFRTLDESRQRLARDEIMNAVLKRLPDATLEVGEVGVLKTELKKKRRHMPLRKLFAKVPTILPRLKPCVLMSPMSVAQYLDPSLSLFDVIVFDEASQIPPWDAIGALGRGKRAIIVGDSKQMPPTSFFGKVDDEAVGDDDVEEMESILDECDRAGLPKLSLKWHYRSRHPSLIQFSNQRYYDSQLVTFPAAAAHVPSLGVKWLPVDGIYDKGGTRQNRVEAEAVVREVVERLLDATHTKSIGVVTLSLPQRDLIDELLEAERRKNAGIERYFDGKQVAEPVFVKNLENVQGDERDVIVFSMSYGPDKDGKVALNLGALNRSGGERRLNVAITRARDALLVVSSLRPEHIVEGRTAALGVRHLREFLAFAQKNGSATSAEEATLREQDSAGCLVAIEAALGREGYRCDRNIGAPGPRVDLAVRDPHAPGQYLLGVVTDSPVWARFPSVRDREKLAPSVLVRQGWRVQRVWSLDWWHDPQREIAKISAALALAEEAARVDRELGPAPLAEPEPAPSEAEVVAAPSAVVAAPSWLDGSGRWRAAPYQKVPAVDLRVTHPPSDPLYHRHVAGRLIEVVQHEGPIHRDEAIRRAFDAWSVPRVGKNMQQAVLDQLRHFPIARHPKLVDDIFWPADLDPAGYTTFRTPGANEARSADSIPAVEIMNATLAILTRALSLGEDELIGQLMLVFGITRRGAKVVEHFKAGITLALGSGAVRDGDLVKLASP